MVIGMGSTWVHRLSNVDSESRTADCAACGPVRVRPRRNHWRCTEAEKAWQRSQHNGTTRLEREAKSEKQGGLCAICGDAAPLCWDHCHTTGKDRGMLCRSCNVGLGHFRDDPARLRKAASYLRKYAQNS